MKWRETKQEPGTAGPGNMLGCSLVSFHFMWAILCPQAVLLALTILHRPRWIPKIEDYLQELKFG